MTTSPRKLIVHRLTSLALAAAVTLGIVSIISESLHIDRIGAGMELVQLERVMVTAEAPAPRPAIAVLTGRMRGDGGN